MKTHCRPHKTLFSLLTFCTFASFNGCDTQTNVVQTPPATPEINAAVQLQNEANEQELKNKKEEEEAKKQAEGAEINAMIKQYKQYIRTTQYDRIKQLDYQTAKIYINELVNGFLRWKYESPTSKHPKGKCVIFAKNVGDITPTVTIYRDELTDPVILITPWILANDNPSIQLQIDDQTPETVNYTNDGGIKFRITEKQYDVIYNGMSIMQLSLTQNDITTHIIAELGDIKSCINTIERTPSNKWKYEESVSSFDNTIYKFCSTESLNKVYADLKLDIMDGRTESPVLLIRQKEHKQPEIILSSSGILWSPDLGHKVSLRFDDEKPISTSFVNGSGTVTQIFLNSEKKLLQKLFSSKRVIFQMPSNHETFSFDLTELPEKCKGLDLSAIKK